MQLDHNRFAVLVVRAFIPLAAAVAPNAPAAAQQNSVVSVNSAGLAGNGPSGGEGRDLSADGRYVVFASDATNLDPLDTTLYHDVYVRDRLLGQTYLASVTEAGGAGDWHSYEPRISADGRYVVFQSVASNMVSGDAGFDFDVFVRDTLAGTTTRVSITTAFGEPDDSATRPDISADGRWIVFDSWASNLVANDTNGKPDVFLRDMQTGVITRVSVGPGGLEGNNWSILPRISDDASTIVFVSTATNFGWNDTSVYYDAFAVDRATGTLDLLSVTPAGTTGSDDSDCVAASADGRFVAFASFATNLTSKPVDGIFVRDRVLGTTQHVSGPIHGAFANGYSRFPDISGDGRWIVFESDANNLAGSETTNHGDVLRSDRLTGEIVLLSTTWSGGESSYGAGGAAISADGSRVVFVGKGDIVQNNPNVTGDVYVHDFTMTLPQSYCIGKPHSEGCTAKIGSSGTPSVSATSGFDVFAQSVRRNAFGLLFYGLAPQGTPFLGGTLCVQPPLKRTGAQNSVGNFLACSGQYHFDFNAWMHAGFDPALQPGSVVFAQYWFRDPQDPTGFGVGFTDARRFVVQP